MIKECNDAHCLKTNAVFLKHCEKDKNKFLWEYNSLYSIENVMLCKLLPIG